MLVLSWFYCFTAHDTPQYRRLHQIRMHPDHNMLMCFFLMCFIHITSPFLLPGYQDSNQDLPRPKHGSETLTRYPETLLLAPTLPAFAGAVRFALAFPKPFRPAASPWDAFIPEG